MGTELLRRRPLLTGLLLGLVLWLFGTGGIETVALLLFVFGIVGAVFGEQRYRPAGWALASSGATVLIFDVLWNVLLSVFGDFL